MENKLDDYLKTRDNNFNLIRLIAAWLVLYSHSYALVNDIYSEPLVKAVQYTLGSFAVDIFFITSGLLIARSLYSRNSLKAFTKARVLRIFPALIVAVFFTVFVIGVIFTTVTLDVYFTSEMTYKYLYRNSILIFNIKYFLPGVFESLPYPNTVNGSLWTLPYEVKSYVFLVIFASGIAFLMKKFNKDFLKSSYLVLAAVLVGCTVLNNFIEITSSGGLTLFAMFATGAAYYVWRDTITITWKKFSIASLVLVASAFYLPAFQVVYFLLIPYIVLGLAFLPKGKIRLFNKLGDYSYGVYIYAFPVQQSLLSLFPEINFSLLVIATSGITLFFAVLSWHLIEKRCLNLVRKKV